MQGKGSVEFHLSCFGSESLWPSLGIRFFFFFLWVGNEFKCLWNNMSVLHIQHTSAWKTLHETIRCRQWWLISLYLWRLNESSLRSVPNSETSAQLVMIVKRANQRWGGFDFISVGTGRMCVTDSAVVWFLALPQYCQTITFSVSLTVYFALKSNLKIAVIWNRKCFLSCRF